MDCVRNLRLLNKQMMKTKTYRPEVPVVLTRIAKLVVVWTCSMLVYFNCLSKFPLKIERKVSYRWKYVYFEAIWQVTPSSRHWQPVQVTLDTLRGRPMNNAICQKLRVSYRWKYVHFEAAWRLKSSTLTLRVFYVWK